MKAIVQHSYGAPGDVLEFTDVDAPSLSRDNEIVVEVRASSVNPADWVYLTGEPMIGRASIGLRGPRHRIPGKDVAGVVTRVGAGVSRYAIGDRVWGEIEAGAYGELVVVDENSVAPMPVSMDFADAAAVPVAGLTALQGLRKADVGSGTRLLIIGASGGVGGYAVQLAKAAGARVTGVCSGRNVSLVQELGADDVIDYTTTEVTTTGERWDVVFDLVGEMRWQDYDRILTERGTLLPCAGYKHGRWFGPMGWVLPLLARGALGKRSVTMYVAAYDNDDMATLADHADRGELRTVVDRRYPLADVSTALSHLNTGRTRGKNVIEVG